MATYRITLDTRKGPWLGEPVRVRSGDAKSCVIVASVTEGGTAKDMSGLKASFRCLKPDKTIVQDDQCTISGNQVSYTLADQVAAVPGEAAAAYFAILNEDGTVIDSTQSFVLVIEEGTGSASVSKDYISDIDTLIALIEQQRERYDAAERLRADAETKRVTAEDGRASAETARADAESARSRAEQGRAEAEDARVAAEGERADAESARASAETERAEAERGRVDAESAREGAEQARAEAESARAEAEGKRAEAETSRSTAEEGRSKAEAARAGAETSRADAESDRASAESARAEAESGRSDAEAERVAAEKSRVTSEGARGSAEQQRVTAEEGRATAEASRAKAEDARAAAETARADSQKANDAAQAKNNADQAANNLAAQGTKVKVCADGEYDGTSGEPTVDGENGVIYLTPIQSATGDNVYNEWLWVDGKFERIGTSGGTFSPITTDQVDSVVADKAPQGNEGLSLTGLSYLWSKLKAAFAPIVHRHVRADITDFPASLPASDVHDWAKAEAKPAYGLAEIGGLADALAAKQSRATYSTVSIAVADWSDGACTKDVDGVTADSVVRVGADPASELVASGAHVYCSAQGDGTLTFACVDVPSAVVTLNVEVREA